MKLSPIACSRAPQPVGPYSQAIDTGTTLFISGQIPLDPQTGSLCGDTIEPQTRCCLQHLAAICDQAGLSLQNLAKITVYLTDLRHFAAFNGVYSDFFSSWRPARAVVEVSRLPKDVLIEIEGIAVR
jgi:2-iminobutanoate/2-iminopropanoate deaminase